MTLFEELLTQYGKTVEDVTFEYEGLSDDELRSAFEEAFGEKEDESEEATTEDETAEPETESKEAESESEDFESESKVIEDESKETEDETKEIEGEELEVQESLEDTEPEAEAAPEPEVEPVVETVVEFTAKIGEQIRTFSISLNDKLEAIYTLVNTTYGELDDDFYDCVVFEDTKTIEMHGYFRGKNYRQTYKVRNNEYQLVGDRVEIFCKWMSEDELNQFENMKSNYAALEQFKADKEAEVVRNEKMELLSEFSDIAETEEFKSLIQNIDTCSKEEEVEKANAICGKLARKGFSFAQQEAPTQNKHFFGFTNNEAGKPNAPAYSGFFN